MSNYKLFARAVIAKLTKGCSVFSTEVVAWESPEPLKAGIFRVIKKRITMISIKDSQMKSVQLLNLS